VGGGEGVDGVKRGTMKYFRLLYRLDAEDRYFIWISDEVDSVVVHDKGLIPSFKDSIVLRRYANLNHYILESEEPVLHNLDRIAAWAASPVIPVDCKEALAAWNLFGDVAASIAVRGIAFERLDSDSKFRAIYKKLFWGNNLPSVTPKGEHYVPEWSPDEIASLAEMLITGLEMFASCARNWPGEP
jgi:hypothetical protein